MFSRWKMWVGFATFTLVIGGYAAYRFFEGDRRWLVPGSMTRGHYPIETECDRCHTPLLGVKTDACNECHAEELTRVDDSHPRSKFEDPRNADRLTKIDARDCVVCHVEHIPERTLAMGFTQPVDVCRHCHDDIATERPSHAGMAFSTCQDAGCHNFHDNRSLHEDYLDKHLGEPPLLDPALLPALTAGLLRAQKSDAVPLKAAQADANSEHLGDVGVLAEWEASAHAQGGVNCSDCHAQGDERAWVQSPDHDACKRCHEDEVAGFLGGKHGMRLAVGLSPMQPSMARLPMDPSAADHSLGCNSCHGAHRFDREHAAVDACLGCHADGHSLAYRDSKHFAALQRELAGQAPTGSGVSCATCHLPRVPNMVGGKPHVQHNQNDFLQPNEKMIDAVCRHCHGVGFAIDALADAALVARGVSGLPAGHVRSIDMVQERSRARAP